MQDILEMISTYGLALVISGLVIYFAIQFGNMFLDDAKKKRDAKKHDALANLRNQISSTIIALLERTVLRARGCRAYVFEFHNGAMSMGGLPFLKMTNTYEALNDGAKSELHKRESMPMQLFASFVDAIGKHESVVMDVGNRTDEFSPFVYETLVERGISVTVRAKITDINQRVIGYFGIDYCAGKPVDADVISEAVKIVEDTAVELGALLSVNMGREGR